MPSRPAKNYPSDEEGLVDAAQNGDQTAFFDLVKRHDESLRSLAFSMTRSETLMDDVLQEAYFKAFRSISSFRRTSSFKTWLYRIVHNAAVDELRRHGRLQATDEVMQSMHGSTSAEDHDLAQRLDIEAALGRLTLAQRTTVLLVDGDGFDYATAGEILGIPPGTVASRVHQARTALRTLLTTSHKDTER